MSIKDYNTRLENNNTNLSEILNTINNLPTLKLQDKSVVPTKEKQTIQPDETYNGLGSVSVEAIPSSYVEPSGTLEITENGEYDVKEKEKVNVNIQQEETSVDVALMEGTLEEYSSTSVTSIKAFAFYRNTTGIVTLDLPNVTTIGEQAFFSCTTLTNINIPNVTSLPNSCFYQATSLKSLNLPKCTSLGTTCIRSCTSLETADMGVLKYIPAWTFTDCSVLTKLILRRTDAICSLAKTNALDNTPIAKGTGYVYVDDNLIETYKTNSTWSTYASQIVGISVLGTTNDPVDGANAGGSGGSND